MDYFHQYLLTYLTEGRLDLVHSMGRDEFFSLLTSRTEAAATAFEQARRQGHDVTTAQELAVQVLIDGLDTENSPAE